MTIDPYIVTPDDVPPDPLLAYRYGYRVAQDQTRDTLYRILGRPTRCYKGHEIWPIYNGKTRGVIYLKIDGTVDRCGEKRDD